MKGEMVVKMTQFDKIEFSIFHLKYHFLRRRKKRVSLIDKNKINWFQ